MSERLELSPKFRPRVIKALAGCQEHLTRIDAAKKHPPLTDEQAKLLKRIRKITVGLIAEYQDWLEKNSVPIEPPNPAGRINMEWLTEQLSILQSHKLKAWTNKSILERLNAVVRGNFATPAEALSHLSPEQAEQFTNSVREVVGMV